MVAAVRGAIQVPENSRHAIEDAAVRLIRELLERNSIRSGEMVSLVLSVTPDLTEMNPATAVRRAGYEQLPLFCVQEAQFKDSLPGIIRMLLTVDTLPERKLLPVYLDGAQALRPDLTAS